MLCLRAEPVLKILIRQRGKPLEALLLPLCANGVARCVLLPFACGSFRLCCYELLLYLSPYRLGCTSYIDVTSPTIGFYYESSVLPSKDSTVGQIKEARHR